MRALKNTSSVSPSTNINTCEGFISFFFAIAMFYLKKDVSFSLSFSMSSMKSNMNSPKVSSMSPAYLYRYFNLDG